MENKTKKTMATSGKKRLTNADLKAGIKALREDNQEHLNSLDYQRSEYIQCQENIQKRDDQINYLRQQIAFLKGKLMGYRESAKVYLDIKEGSLLDHYHRNE